MALLAGCMRDFQQEILVEIGPSESAFKVPLEGQTSAQEQAQSEEYLKKNQVFTKRVSLAQRWQETGRMSNMGKWINAERVIKVNRAPVTREWTHDDKSGTTGVDQSIPVGSLDSIAFGLNCTLTAEVDPDDAAKFIFKWSGDLDHEVNGSTRKLEIVIDTTVRSFISTSLQAKFGSVSLTEGLKNKEKFFHDTLDEARAEFKPNGITISFFGLHGNPRFVNPKVQETLDNKFISENAKLIAMNDTVMQLERNKQLVNAKEGEANMAIEAARGESESKKKVADGEAYAIEVKAKAEAGANRAKAAALEGEGGARLIAMQQILAWDGKFPQWWMGGGSPSILLNVPGPTK